MRRFLSEPLLHFVVIGAVLAAAGAEMQRRRDVYRIVVTIDKQSVAAGGNTFPLRAGMVASADLLMEKRTLLEWLFQPVIQLRERMRSGASSNA